MAFAPQSDAISGDPDGLGEQDCDLPDRRQHRFKDLIPFGVLHGEPDRRGAVGAPQGRVEEHPVSELVHTHATQNAPRPARAPSLDRLRGNSLCSQCILSQPSGIG